MDKEKELKFLEALYMIQKASDLGSIRSGEEPDEDTKIYEQAYLKAKGEPLVTRDERLIYTEDRRNSMKQY